MAQGESTAPAEGPSFQGGKKPPKNHPATSKAATFSSKSSKIIPLEVVT